jgi:phenylpropionate dioxygenase-like ring-hydroxylating dioxygenase large terminal subunit
MFKLPPKIFSHISSLDNGNFVLPDIILNKDENNINLFHRFCPHRMYPLAKVGQHVENIVCKFHGFEWTKDGVPVNNNRRLNCGNAQIGKSGLIFKNFIEPDHRWVSDLANETNLKFSHVTEGASKGSWLWIMEIQADLLHVRPGEDAVHPWLSSVEDLEEVNMESGDGWIIQTCSTGWWLFIYPFTFIEWSPGCLAVNYTIPNDINSEFGFSWVTQFYYDQEVSKERKIIFEKLEDVFCEDIDAIESQKGKYFPLIESTNKLEDHCVHFGQWVKEHRVK